MTSFILFLLTYLFFYYKVSYIKYRNIHKQRTAQTTWKVQKARTVQLGAANRRNKYNAVTYVKSQEISQYCCENKSKNR